ncbi:hypothetical protein SK355_13960 [Candidatus Fukatsuia symbiotica]|nr:hypothetical protein [Candidatus Fukatsuia symbiotica]MEA9446253.1 hypothetical protein [Candidatus Fukatsuia symbiotica]
MSRPHLAKVGNTFNTAAFIRQLAQQAPPHLSGGDDDYCRTA